MNKLLALALAKTGLKVAGVVVKFTTTNKDDLVVEFIENISFIISKLSRSDFEITPEINKLNSIIADLKKAENGGKNGS